MSLHLSWNSNPSAVAYRGGYLLIIPNLTSTHSQNSMLMKKALSILALVAAVFLVSCGGNPTPSEAAVKVYQMVKDGNYEGVAENIFYDSDNAQDIEEAKAMITSLLKEKAGPMIESKGGVKDVEVVNETVAEDGQSATVELKITYGDGSEETEKANMKLDDGQWKLAMNK